MTKVLVTEEAEIKAVLTCQTGAEHRRTANRVLVGLPGSSNAFPPGTLCACWAALLARAGEKSEDCGVVHQNECIVNNLRIRQRVKQRFERKAVALDTARHPLTLEAAKRSTAYRDSRSQPSSRSIVVSGGVRLSSPSEK